MIVEHVEADGWKAACEVRDDGQLFVEVTRPTGGCATAGHSTWGPPRHRDTGEVGEWSPGLVLDVLRATIAQYRERDRR